MKEKDEEKIPLKTILTNFLNHVETLEAKREEGEDLYEKEFQSLKQFSDELKGKEDFSTSEGDREVNRKKNRYKDILPFNYTRVLLSEYPGVPGSDYINANYIKGASGSNAYIASQGPLPHTVNDWWRMVDECEVQVIVMACNEQEAGKHKCECYWTADSEVPQKYGKYSVTLLKCREICPDFLVRTMRLEWASDEGQDEERTVCQFHYSAWPDHGIPTQVQPLLEMVRLIRDCQASETLPVLIHCSAGCGRTGTICVIDFVWGLLRTGKLTSDFSLYALVQDMRRQRIAMVQTVDQYMLCHRAVKQLFLEQLRVIDSHPYENVGCDGRPLAADSETITPDYETIFIKGQGEVDIERVLSARSSLPRMGVGMLRDTPMTNGEGSEGSEQSLPATLEDFQASQPAVEPAKPSGPTIHDPPPAASTSVPAPQRYKKGNLRLLQGEDGGWKLEELEEKRRSLESQKLDQSRDKEDKKNESFEKKEDGASPRSGEKPPQAEAKSRKKKSREEKSEGGGPSLMRKPSMKKLKALFDKDKNKENKADKEEKSDADYASAVSKLPSLEPNGEGPLLPGSKSVPSSLDRKQRYRETDYAQLGSLDTRSNPSAHQRHWPLGGRQGSSDGLQERPALPVKRSKSMKSITPGQLTTEPSFGREDFRDSAEPSSPYDTYPKTKPRSEELIDLTKRQPNDLDPYDGRTRFDFTPEHIRQGSGGDGWTGEDPRTTYHFGEGAAKQALAAPPKPKRDWSSLNHDYANLAMCGGRLEGEQEKRPGQADREHIRTQLRDFVNVKMRKEGGGVVAHARQGSGDSQPHHPRQSSTDSTEKNSEFLDTQMAKLLERKGHSRDETDSGLQVIPDPASMRRSKSGEIPRPPALRPKSGEGLGPPLGRSVSGELTQRNPEILDEDARKMLKDCQEYLQGAFDPAENGSNRQEQSIEGSPRGSVGRAARSLHSSPGNSYSKYSGSSTNLNRSHSGQLNMSPPGTIQKSVSSPTGTAHRSYCGPPKPDASPREEGRLGRPLDDRASLNSDVSEGSKQSPHNETGPSSLEEGAPMPEYQNVDRRVEAQARGKLREATNVRNRERRNSFRQAVDTKAAQQVDQYGRPYEAIWFPPGQEEEQTSPRTSNGVANIDTRLLADGPVYANAAPLVEGKVERKRSQQEADARKLSTESQGLDPRQLRKSDISLRSSNSGHIRSGSYDNIPTPVLQGQYSPDPPNSYEAITFPGRRSTETEPGLQSVGLVAEACRDYERREPRDPRAQEARPQVTRQNSGSSIGGHGRLPPPYQSPPGPPPPYQPPPLSAATSPQRQIPSKHTSPQHSGVVPRGFHEPSPQEPMTSTPKRPQQAGPRYPAPPPYPMVCTTIRPMSLVLSCPVLTGVLGSPS